MFKNCESLVELKLDGNEIEIIPSDIFQTLSNLEDLSLGKKVFVNYLYLNLISLVQATTN